MQQTVTSSLTPYVTSSFAEHSLTATTSVMSSIIGGLFKLPLAKILDIWGRPQGYLLMVFFLTIGLVMMAACQNVQTYAAAQVFYWVGYVANLLILRYGTLMHGSVVTTASTTA
jgi:MFS family permease